MSIIYQNASHTDVVFNGTCFSIDSPDNWDSIGDGPTKAAIKAWLAEGNTPIPFLLPTKTLEQRKQEIDAERDRKLAAGVLWNGHLWYTDDVFQGQITARVAGWNAGIISASATKPVRSKAGQVQMLTYDQHKSLSAALFDYVEGIYGWSWIAKESLARGEEPVGVDTFLAAYAQQNNTSEI